MKKPEGYLNKPRKHKKKKLDNKFKREDIWAEIEARGFTDISNVMCEECNERPAVDCHHKVHRSSGGTGERSNMALICRQCHSQHH